MHVGITLLLLVLWYFFNAIGIIGIGIINIYLFWTFFGGSKSAKLVIERKEGQIIDILNGRGHYHYIKENALYFLYPAASKKFAETCSIWGIGCFILGVIFIFKANWISLIFCVFYCSTSWFLSSKFIKPMEDYKLAERTNGIMKDRLDNYLDFFATKWRTL